jgi:peptidoglycan-associated lipoprotein
MTSQRTRLHAGLMILFGVFLFTSCHHNPPPPPPPPTPTATPPAPAPMITLRATPATIERGGSTTLQWEARNSASVRIEPGIGDVTANGNRSVSPGSSVTYMATATGPGGSASDTARVTVNAPVLPEPSTPPPTRTTPNANIDELFGANVRPIYFDYDKSDIRPDQVARLEANAAWLKQNPNIRLTVEGHCDERGSQEYNLALGDRRANAVKEFLLSQGIAQSRMNVISYGEERPACHEETDDCYQRNRRAEFVMNP